MAQVTIRGAVLRIHRTARDAWCHCPQTVASLFRYGVRALSADSATSPEQGRGAVAKPCKGGRTIRRDEPRPPLPGLGMPNGRRVPRASARGY